MATNSAKKKAQRWLTVIIGAMVVAVYGGYQHMNRSAAANSTTTDGAVVAEEIDACGLEIPQVDNDEFVINSEQGRYTLLYDTLSRQAVWVAYVLTRDDMSTKTAERSNHFVPDPEVTERGWPTAQTYDYSRSGYDRGHLCPSADRDNSQAENDATFHMSNISPQTKALNGGVWKDLEERVRECATRFDSVYVVAGGVRSDDMKMIKNGIRVPRQFFKVLLTHYRGEWHAIGFVFPNTSSIKGDFGDYAVSVDSVEALTGIDFFYQLTDDVEDRVEALVDRSFWID